MIDVVVFVSATSGYACVSKATSRCTIPPMERAWPLRPDSAGAGDKRNRSPWSCSGGARRGLRNPAQPVKKELVEVKEGKELVIDRGDLGLKANRYAPIVPGVLKARVRQYDMGDGLTFALASDVTLSCLPVLCLCMVRASKSNCVWWSCVVVGLLDVRWDKTRNGLTVPHQRLPFKISPCHERKYTAI